MPVVLASLAIAVTAIVLSHRISRALTQESVVVNAADAAAYSGAAWTARRLNLIAYTNRALVANHIAVGHLTATISWLRYVDEGATKIANYSRYLPYVGQATSAAERTVALALLASERSAAVMIRGFDLLHRLMAISQLDARADLRPGRVDAVMTRVAKAYDETLAVNDSDAIEAIPTPYRSAMTGLLAGQRISAYRKLQRSRTGRDQGYFARLIAASIDHDPSLRRWLDGSRTMRNRGYGSGRRGWERSLISLVRFRKQGHTHQPDLPDAGGWRSADRFQVSFFNLGKLEWGGWSTAAEGAADADALGGGYRGVRHYTRLRAADDNARLMQIPALVTGPIPGTTTDGAISAHLGMAEVRYHIPAKCGADCPRAGAPASLFNPYWEATLAAPSLPGLP